MAEQTKLVKEPTKVKTEPAKKVSKEQLKTWDKKAQENERRRRWVLGLGSR